jgi:adenosylcobinamide-GDP ribazoletransferase
VGSLILAIRFLTIVPVPGPDTLGPSALGRAAWWFPVVGLALGGGLVVADRVTALALPRLVDAAVLIALWKVATGAIHLDGLADSLDGLASHDAARRLAIMQDSRIGVFGASGLVLFLVSSVMVVAELSGPARDRLLLLAPVVGRVAPLLVGAWLGPATPGHGLGAAFVAGLSRWAGPAHAVAASGLALWLLGPWGVAIAVTAWSAAILAACIAAGGFGGLTGDVLGAVVEIAELSTLLAGVAANHRGLL